MIRTAFVPASEPTRAARLKRERERVRASQRRAADIVWRFLLISFVWIALSGAAMRLLPNVGFGVKAVADVAFLAFATFTLHSKVLRALTEAERSDLAYRSASVELIERLAVVGEHRDDLTGGHARRIGAMAGGLGAALGLGRAECERLELAATLHDLGKVGIPDAILNKAGDLTPLEREEMETHVAIGARMLDGGSHPLIRTAHLVALTHHENWDGNGYPQGLRGEEIPLVGRIVAVCDVYDALVTARPYKKAWRAEDALDEIRRLSGSKFDPNVVGAFMRLHAETLPGVGERVTSDK